MVKFAKIKGSIKGGFPNTLFSLAQHKLEKGIKNFLLITLKPQL